MRSQRLRGEDPVMDAITRSMGNLIRCMNRYRAEHLAPLALKPCHAGYLLEICACPGISQEQLSRRIYANKSNVARQLAALEEGGYVERRPGEEDRRVMRVYPTEKALAALPQIQAIMDSWETAVAGGLTEEEREKLSALLEDMTCRAAALLEEQ